MSNLGIIVEYNPFHNGHIFHIENSKKITNSTNVIAVMSGNFVQRGEPAILDKYARTDIALNNGVDVVIELPTLFSTSSAELFAESSISILDKTNIIDSICFGSEVNDIEILKSLSKILLEEPPEYKAVLKNELSKGVNFPKARETALQQFGNNFDTIIKTPNNILGIEYLKALRKQKSNIKPFLLPRNSANYNDTSIPTSDTSVSIASATAIRQALRYNDIDKIIDFVPMDTYLYLKYFHENEMFPNYENMFYLLKFKLITMDKKVLSNIYDVTEGLDARLLNTIAQSTSYEDLILNLKTKRFTQTKIQRLLLHILISLEKDFVEKNKDNIPYIRVLGFKKEKSFLIKDLIEKSSLPVVLNIKNANLSTDALLFLEKEFEYTNIYNQLINQNYNKKYKNILLSDMNFEKKIPLIIYDNVVN